MRGQYNVGQIKSNKMATAVQAVEGKINQQVDIEDLSKNPIECPIIMDEDVPQAKLPSYLNGRMEGRECTTVECVDRILFVFSPPSHHSSSSL